MKPGPAIAPQARKVFSLSHEISFIFSRVKFKLLSSFSACVPQQQNRRVTEHECFAKPRAHHKTKEPQHHDIKILVFTPAEPPLPLQSTCNLVPLEPPKLPARPPSPGTVGVFSLWDLCRVPHLLSPCTEQHSLLQALITLCCDRSLTNPHGNVRGLCCSLGQLLSLPTDGAC